MTTPKLLQAAILLSVAATILLLGKIASGQRPWALSRAQGELLAKIAINENTSPLRNPWDNVESDLISSVVFNNKGKVRARSWVELMRGMAPHVGLMRTYTSPQQEWTSTLVGCTETQPRLWVPDRDGNWKQFAKPWKRFCESVRDRWVNSTFVHNPHVMTWGSTQDTRHLLCPGVEPARHRNICILTNAPTGVEGGNWFFGLPRTAPCDPSREEAFKAEYCPRQSRRRPVNN